MAAIVPQNEAGLHQLMGDLVPRIKSVQSNAITPQKLARMTMMAASANPTILKCTQDSIALSVLNAAALGLDFGPTGQAYLVPYWSGRLSAYECQLIIGYRGMITLARRSGEIASIQAHLIYSNDHFVYELGTESSIVHRPRLGDRGEVIGAYAVARLKNADPQFEVMDIDALNAIKARALKGKKNEKSSPWTTDTEEMHRKTVMRRLFKWLPCSTDIEKGLALADAGVTGGQVSVTEADGPLLPEPAKPQPRTKQLSDALGGNGQSKETTESAKAVAALIKTAGREKDAAAYLGSVLVGNYGKDVADGVWFRVDTAETNLDEDQLQYCIRIIEQDLQEVS